MRWGRRAPIVRIVVMGPSGSGKSLVGAALAARLRARFVDGDDLQAVQKLIKDQDYDFAVQFTNYR